MVRLRSPSNCSSAARPKSPILTFISTSIIMLPSFRSRCSTSLECMYWIAEMDCIMMNCASSLLKRERVREISISVWLLHFSRMMYTYHSSWKVR